MASLTMRKAFLRLNNAECLTLRSLNYYAYKITSKKSVIKRDKISRIQNQKTITLWFEKINKT